MTTQLWSNGRESVEVNPNTTTYKGLLFFFFLFFFLVFFFFFFFVVLGKIQDSRNLKKIKVGYET